MVITEQELGKIGRRHCSALAENALYKGGNEIKTRHSNAHPLYTE
jgi:hypothetical protein